MHISEGVLSAPLLAGGAVIAIAGTAVGLAKLDYDDMPRAGILAATFYVVSLFTRIPLASGAASIHLVLTGLVGLVLGWGAFPAILLALLLQAVFFQHGGLTVLGVNTTIMAAPAVLGWMLFARAARSEQARTRAVAAFACGFTVVLLSGFLSGLVLFLNGESFHAAAYTLASAHLPLAVLEGYITAFAVDFLHRVRPEILAGPACRES